MKAVWSIALLALAGCASMGSAASNKTDAGAAAFMKGYTEAWNRHDAATIARDYYDMGRTVEAQTEANKKTFADLVAQGYDKSDIKEIKACVTGPDTAWAGMHFTRLKTDGTPLGPRERASSYDLKYTDGKGWRIVKLNGGDPSKPLECPKP